MLEHGDYVFRINFNSRTSCEVRRKLIVENG